MSPRNASARQAPGEARESQLRDQAEYRDLGPRVNGPPDSIPRRRPSNLTLWRWAVGEAGLPGSVVAVALALAHYMNTRKVTCWPSHATIAARAGLSVATVKRALDTLREAGLLRSTPRGRKRSLLYVGIVPAKQLEADELQNLSRADELSDGPNELQNFKDLELQGEALESGGASREDRERSTATSSLRDKGQEQGRIEEKGLEREAALAGLEAVPPQLRVLLEELFEQDPPSARQRATILQGCAENPHGVAKKIADARRLGIESPTPWIVRAIEAGGHRRHLEVVRNTLPINPEPEWVALPIVATTAEGRDEVHRFGPFRSSDRDHCGTPVATQVVIPACEELRRAGYVATHVLHEEATSPDMPPRLPEGWEPIIAPPRAPAPQTAAAFEGPF